jgi:hypothetical protein
MTLMTLADVPTPREQAHTKPHRPKFSQLPRGSD